MSIVMPTALVTLSKMPDNSALSKVETGPPNEPKNALAVLINPHWKPLTNTDPQSLTPPSLTAIYLTLCKGKYCSE